MPIEIRELVIKVQVSDEDNKGVKNSSANANTGNSDAIVKECIDKVLEILKEKNAR